MVSSIVRPFALLLPLALVMLPGVAARAQQPKLEMHRAAVDSKDPSGWYPAVSTKGSFSVRMPIPFNDFTVRSADPKTGEEATHVIGGKSTECIKFSAVELPASAKSAPSLEKILADFSAKSGNKVSDVQRAAKGRSIARELPMWGDIIKQAAIKPPQSRLVVVFGLCL